MLGGMRLAAAMGGIVPERPAINPGADAAGQGSSASTVAVADTLSPTVTMALVPGGR